MHLTWVPDALGGGTLVGSTTDIPVAFTLGVDKFGDYTFSANAPLVHPFTADPANPGSHAFEDNLKLVFTYTVTDGDGDQADAHLTINIDDDVPNSSVNGGATLDTLVLDESRRRAAILRPTPPLVLASTTAKTSPTTSTAALTGADGPGNTATRWS